MMKYKITAWILGLFCCFSTTKAQTTIEGTVLNKSNEPVSYVNIGLPNKNLGTVADEKGYFLLQIPPSFYNDTLCFSCVGYEIKQIPIKEILTKKTTTIYLSAKQTVLQEVIVVNNKPTIKKIGTRSANPFLWGSISSKDGKDIVEVSKLLTIEKPVQIQKIHLFLKGISIDTATFRINFYTNNAGLPGIRMYDKPLFFTKALSKGWLEINVEDFDIYIENSFFMSVEFLPQVHGKKYAFSYGGQLGGSVFTRTNSLGNWFKNTGVTASFYITAKQ